LPERGTGYGGAGGGGGLRCPPFPVQNNPPYNVGAFRFELSFSPRHPLSPPCATLCTPIYHPAVDPEGRVCQPLTSPQHWVPTTRALHGGYPRGPPP
ncbi:UB2L5 enzyme, partial [Geococcyx californianus]|nr:UB2L5 enzyme [Geococcyx californianus]